MRLCNKLKCGHPGLSQSAFTDILCLFKRVLEESRLENVKIKDTYKSSFSCIEELLVPSKTVDICINDCMSFTGEYAILDSCPVCKESRYVFSKPVKQYEYIELLPRIAQFYELPNISKLLQVPAKDGKLMTDFKDSPRWKEIFEGDGHFKINSLCTLLEYSGLNVFDSYQNDDDSSRFSIISPMTKKDNTILNLFFNKQLPNNIFKYLGATIQNQLFVRK
ncbi:hypothetical protein SNE40_004064 [Patella caerulea]|uniref:Uncharacterized protein n=1 Tax=Patella caerulea TaxID=87958 RepID=A0AAN8K9A2_PATCE